MADRIDTLSANTTQTSKVQRINITRHLIPTRISTIVVYTALFVVLWGLNLMADDSGDFTSPIPALFLNTYTLWSLPALVASTIGAVVSIAILVAIWLAAQRRGLAQSRTGMLLIVGFTLTAAIDYLHYFNHSYIAIIPLFVAIDQMMNMYDFKQQTKAAFNIAILISTASLFEPIFIWFILLFIAGMAVYRVISWRTLMGLFTGLATMAYLLISICWLTDNIDTLTVYSQQTIDFALIDPTQWRWSDIGFAAAMIVLWLITIVNYITHRGSYSLNLRINFVFVCWCFICTLALTTIAQNHTTPLIMVLTMLLTLNINLYFTTNRKTSANIIFILFTLATIAYRILWLLGY